MFGKSARSEAASNRIDTLIGRSTVIRGDVSFYGGLRIEGVVYGDVNVKGAGAGLVVLMNDGCVNGNVRSSRLVSDATVNGSVFVTELVELWANARISGDVHYGALEIKEGAVVQGHLVNHRHADHPV